MKLANFLDLCLKLCLIAFPVSTCVLCPLPYLVSNLSPSILPGTCFSVWSMLLCMVSAVISRFHHSAWCLLFVYYASWYLLYCTVLYCTLLYSTVLYCTLLYCTLLYCSVLYCTILYCTLLYCNVLYSTVLYSTVLYYTVLYSTVLYSTVLYCIGLYCFALNCTVLHWTVLHRTVKSFFKSNLLSFTLWNVICSARLPLPAYVLFILGYLA